MGLFIGGGKPMVDESVRRGKPMVDGIFRRDKQIFDGIFHRGVSQWLVGLIIGG